jgi:hypothetical protein
MQWVKNNWGCVFRKCQEDIAFCGNVYAKAKAVPLHAKKAPGWKGGIAPTHFSTSALDGVSDQRHTQAAL